MTTMSQDEINAMLAGVGAADDAPPAETADENQPVVDAGGFDRQAEVDFAAEAALDEAAVSDGSYESAFFTENAEMLSHEPLPVGTFDVNAPEWQLTDEEIDVLGEVGNICMGAVATTMYTLLDRRCEITTPRVSVHTTQQVLNEYATPFVVVEVEYIEGIDGKNLLLLKEMDAAMITDLLMGGDGQVEEPVELTELHMSAISEIMNQMIGASATAMAKVLGMPVNISPPQSVRVEHNQDVGEYLDQSQVIVKVSFDLEIEGLLKSQLLQMIPFSLSKNMVKQVKAVSDNGGETNGNKSLVDVPSAQPAAAAPAPAAAAAQPAPQPVPAAAPPADYGYPPQQQQGYGYPQQGYGYPQPGYGYPQQPQPQPGNLVDVRPMQFQPFDGGGAPQATGQGMGLVHDIPLTVTVELGKTKKNISDILEFGMGTVIVLDKVAGDPVEVLANGKLIARGEVVILDENYGVRITDILS